MDEREAILHAKRLTHAWFSLAVLMDPATKTHAEVTTRKFTKVSFRQVAADMCELDCGSIRFPDLDSGKYDFLAMSFTPADPARLLLNLGPPREDNLPTGIEIDSGDTITVNKIMIFLPPKRERVTR